MGTYETGDSGVVVSGHDWVEEKEKERWEIRSVGERTSGSEDARDETNQRVRRCTLRKIGVPKHSTSQPLRETPCLARSPAQTVLPL